MKKKGFTLIELLVVIAIIAMLLAILMPALNKVKKIAQRVVCGTNLKGLGTAQLVYASDYDDEYVVQGGRGSHTLSHFTNGAYNPQKQWNVDGNMTVGASLYLLVREADVSPKSFICPSGDETEFEGAVGTTLDIIELWDFGNYNVDDTVGPMNCNSYSYHQPYAVSGARDGQQSASKGRYAADGSRSAAFAMMGDRNPYFSEKLENGGVTQANWLERVGGLNWQDDAEKWQIQVANAQSHSREGQNVTFGDGHVTFSKRADVGVKNDNIYTPWNGTAGTDEGEWRTGLAGKALNDPLAHLPRSSNDSVLVNDDNDGTLE